MKPIIGIILPTSDDFYCIELAIGIEDAILDAGYCALIGYSHEDLESEHMILSQMLDSDFEGIIVVPAGIKNHDYECYNRKNVRTGNLSATEAKQDQCSVSSDHVRGGFLGIEYLHQLGHKRIVWVSGPEQHRQSSERILGIAQAVTEFELDLTTISVPALDFLSGEWVAPQILALEPLPDAVFAANDAVAMGIINHLTLAGVKVPESISVLGFDNTLSSETALIPLSTVSQTPYQLGNIMGEQLITDLRATNEHTHQRVIFQSKIIERASTQRRR